jgi:predicted amidophosphoribosyltransferase
LALGSYDGLLRTLVLRMKTDASELLADALAQLWWESHGRSVAATGVDAVTCVPMHPWKRWRRGVNAPAAIAERVAQQLAVPGWLGFLKKRRNRLPQKGLSRAGRLRNIRGGVFASTRYPIQSAHVLLVDDVLTTGATCHESARIAKQAGAREVTVAVVARATTD